MVFADREPTATSGALTKSRHDSWGRGPPARATDHAGIDSRRKDAGEIGAGHRVTALYEVVPAGTEVPIAASVDPLKYQTPAKAQPGPGSGAATPAASELLTVKLRYKAPDGETSRKMEVALPEPEPVAASPSTEFEFAASVAAFGLLLRNSPSKGQASWSLVGELAHAWLGSDPGGYRAECVELVKLAAELAAEKKASER
ncbi:MAG: DUF3520 domain-containing protein [Planctomycetes bacterium]|nr:DUF3520 domain-containing protein [Planctomycetota bacterium]